MPEQPLVHFSFEGPFNANPHLYDYLHCLKFDSTGVVTMDDGAGQVLNTLIQGKFSVESLEPSLFRVHLADLVEINPYYKLERLYRLDETARAKSKILLEDVPYEEQDVIRRLAPFSVQVTREEGLFLLKCQVVWKVQDLQDWPYIFAQVRYRFASDPLKQHEQNRQGNLYYYVEPPEPDTCIYYRREDVQRLTARQLHEAGITTEEYNL